MRVEERVEDVERVGQARQRRGEVGAAGCSALTDGSAVRHERPQLVLEVGVVARAKLLEALERRREAVRRRQQLGERRAERRP